MMVAPKHAKKTNTKTKRTMRKPLQGSQRDDGEGAAMKKKNKTKIKSVAPDIIAKS